jgi:predicted SprT family Zn-dependent metalloprotease
MLFPFPQVAPTDIISLFIEDIMAIIGNRFGKWLVIDCVGYDANSNQLYKCQCECGFIKDQRKHTLVSGDSTQCKRCRMTALNRVENLIGQQFGSWIVIAKEKNESRNEWLYKCACKCGTQRFIAGSNLKAGSTTKCHRCRCRTHGMSHTSTFRIWGGILRRCFNSNFKAFKYYGGRGITICDRWLKFENFIVDMGIRPAGLQIDRINNNGNYEPGNCRWVTAAVNLSNRNVNMRKKEK